MNHSAVFDPRLAAKILNVVRVSHERGFKEAIDLSSEVLANVKFIQEKRLIGKYLKEIEQDTGKYVVGLDDTLNGLDSGAAETLIVWENLDINRYVLRNSTTGETVIKFLNKEQESNTESFKVSNIKLDVEEKMSLLEWLADEYMRFGCALEFVTNQSEEGSKFCKGYGGIGAILRYQLDMSALDSDDGEVIDEDDDYSD